MNWEDQLGVKLSVIVSAVIGGIISLTHEEKISFVKALIMIFTGATTAAFTYPLLESYFEIQPAFANGVGFFLGLISMRIIESILTLADGFKKNPYLLLQLLFPTKHGQLSKLDKPVDSPDVRVDNGVQSTKSITAASKKTTNGKSEVSDI